MFKRLILPLLLLANLVSTAQRFQKPNNSYGTISNRGSFDSTLFFPTGCGVPTDSTWLFSYGSTGTGEKLKKFAIYGDSCGGKVWMWNPRTETWATIIGTDSAMKNYGGAPGVIVDSLVNRPNADAVFEGLLFVAKDNGIIYLDTSAGPSAGWKQLTGGSGGGSTDTTSLSNRIDLKADKATTLHIGTLTQDLSANRAFLTNLVDALQVVNAGGARSLAVGTFSARPAVGTTGDLYFVSDSAYRLSIWTTSWQWITNNQDTLWTALPLYVDKSGAKDSLRAKNDSAAWNAKAIRGVAVSPTAPANNQVLIYNSGNSRYEPGSVATASFDSLTSQGGIFHTGLFNDTRFLKRSDTVGSAGVTTFDRTRKVADSLGGLIANRIFNAGNATAIQAGAWLSRPATPTSGTFYWSTDSAFWSYYNGAWKDLKPGTSGGSVVDSAVVILGGKLNMTRGPGTVRYIGTDSLATRLLPTERVLYNANNWTTSDIAYYFSYTGSGTELNSVGGKIVLTGGTQTMAAGNNTAFNKVLKLNWYGGTLLPYVKITTVYRVNGTINSTSAGLATGQYSINALGSLSHMMAWTNTTSTGTGTTYAVLGSSNTAMDASASTFAYASTQQIMQIVERVGDKVFVSAKNLTTDSPMVQTVHQWDGTSAVNGITPNVPNTGMFGWANLSGAEIDSICITTRCPYGAPLGVFTDSKGLYSVPSDVSLAAQIQRFYPGSVLCYGPTDGIRDLRARQREIDTVLHPLQSLVVSIPRNEYAFGVNEFTITRPACISYDSAVRANGIISIWTDGIFENQTTQNGLTYFIDSAFGTPVNQYGPKLIKTKNVGALVANVAKDNIHVSIAGAYNNARTMFASGKITDYSQRINSVYSTDDNWSRWIDSTKTLSLDMAFGNYRPDTYNLGDILVREGAVLTSAFGTPAQKNRWLITSSADASAEIQNWTGGNVATTQAFKIKTTTVTGVTPTTKFGIWEDGRVWVGSVTPFRLYHSAANTMDFYFGGGIAGGTNQTDSTDGGIIPYNSLGMIELYSYGRAGGVTFKLPTSNNTVRRYINAYAGGRFVIGDSVDNAIRMFTLKGSARLFKDSLQRVTVSSKPLGIDTLTGDVVILPPVDLSTYRLFADTVVATGTSTNGHLNKVADSLMAVIAGLNFYTADGALSSNRTVNLGGKNLSYAGTGAISFGNFGQVAFNTPTFLSNATSFGSAANITSGTTATLSNVQTKTKLNPASLIAAFTFTMPPAPIDGQVVGISFGGTITSGNVVVTALTIAPNSGQTLVQAVAPTTAISGDYLQYRWDSGNSSWYQEHH